MSKTGNKVVFGIYKTRSAVDAAISQFKAEGFRTEDISVLLPERSTGDNAGFESYRQDAPDLANVKSSKAPEGATTGAASGMALGGALGWLVGAGALAITGFGPLIAAGPLMAALAGAGVGGAVGSLTGGLIGMGIPEYEAKRFETSMKEGGILLSVHADNSDWVKKAKELMTRTGAEHVSSTTESGEGRTTQPRDEINRTY